MGLSLVAGRQGAGTAGTGPPGLRDRHYRGQQPCSQPASVLGRGFAALTPWDPCVRSVPAPEAPQQMFPGFFLI